MRTLLIITLLLLGNNAFADQYEDEQRLRNIETQLRQIQFNQFRDNAERMDAEWRIKNGY